MGGDKSGSSGKAHDYYGSIAGVVCAGPVDELVAVIIDGKLAWPAAAIWLVETDYAVGDLVHYAFRVWRCTSAHTSASGNAPPDPTKWTSYSVARAGQPSPYPFSIEKWGQAYFYWGTADQVLAGPDPVPDPIATASRSRWHNYAKIITATAHGLATGQHVKISGFTGAAAAYNVEDVAIIEVEDATTFRYYNVGPTEY